MLAVFILLPTPLSSVCLVCLLCLPGKSHLGFAVYSQPDSSIVYFDFKNSMNWLHSRALKEHCAGVSSFGGNGFIIVSSVRWFLLWSRPYHFLLSLGNRLPGQKCWNLVVFILMFSLANKDARLTAFCSDPGDVEFIDWSSISLGFWYSPKYSLDISLFVSRHLTYLFGNQGYQRKLYYNGFKEQFVKTILLRASNLYWDHDFEEITYEFPLKSWKRWVLLTVSLDLQLRK